MAATCTWKSCEETDKDAYIVKFSNGLVKNAKHLDLKLFKHEDDVNPRKKNRRIVVAESNRLPYVGSNFGSGSLQCNNLCRYFVGVLDKSTMQMKVHNAQMFNMLPVIPGESVVDDNTKQAETYREKVDALIEAFGTTKQKRALTSRRLNEVGNEALQKAVAQAASNIIVRKGVKALRKEVVAAEAQTEACSNLQETQRGGHSKTGSLDCQVGYPTLTPGQTVTYEINFDFNLNQLKKNAVVNFEVQSDSEEEVTSDNKVSLSIPVQYDAGIILSRDMSLDYCAIGAEDQVKHTVSDFNDIGPEFIITLQVSTGTFPINQTRLTVSLPTSTKAGNPLLYVTSVKTPPVGNVRCDSSALTDPLNIREKTYTASFTKQSFRGTTELNCKAAKCETMTCVLNDLKMKTNYFVNITARIWNGTFAFADFQTVLVAGSSDIETSQLDLIVITHKQQQIKITVSKEKAIGDIPIGVIIGSVIGGLLLFVLATVILWKVGFFKRKQLPQNGNEQDQAEQEGLCENPA